MLSSFYRCCFFNIQIKIHNAELSTFDKGSVCISSDEASPVEQAVKVAHSLYVPLIGTTVTQSKHLFVCFDTKRLSCQFKYSRKIKEKSVLLVCFERSVRLICFICNKLCLKSNRT